MVRWEKREKQAKSRNERRDTRETRRNREIHKRRRRTMKRFDIDAVAALENIQLTVSFHLVCILPLDRLCFLLSFRFFGFPSAPSFCIALKCFREQIMKSQKFCRQTEETKDRPHLWIMEVMLTGSPFGPSKPMGPWNVQANREYVSSLNWISIETAFKTQSGSIV